MEEIQKEVKPINELSKYEVLNQHRDYLIKLKSDLTSRINDTESKMEGIDIKETHILEELEKEREPCIVEINDKFNGVKSDLNRKCAQKVDDLAKYKAKMSKDFEATDDLLKETDSELITVSDQEVASLEYRKELSNRLVDVSKFANLSRPFELVLEKNRNWSNVFPIYLRTKQVILL